jgi:Protein of unknown function (DUF3142)
VSFPLVSFVGVPYAFFPSDLVISAKRHMRRLGLRSTSLQFVLVCALFCLVAIAWSWRTHQKPHRLQGPNLVFWAWERPEDLRFLNPKKEAVAFLASSVELLPDGVRVYRRMQPLLLGPGTQLIAVVRVYSHANAPASLDSVQLNELLNTAVAASAQPQVSELQIDFDARSSERSFYSHFLSELRHRLGPSYPISITALASWCIGDRWIRDLPVNEAVPMLFSLGQEESAVRQYLSSHSSFPEPHCRRSVGLSTGEWSPNAIHSQTRVYVFSHEAWTRKNVELVRSRLSGF